MRDTEYIETSLTLPKIDPSNQTLGILEASANWFDKISRENGGKERKQFIAFLGVLFNKSLVADTNMSYPGHNGFSLEIQDQESNPKIDKFLKEASDFGDLQERAHTTKNKDRKKRVKWYLNPMLSPYFKIPPTHPKEPKYITIDELKEWLLISIQLNNFLDLVPLASKPNKKNNSGENESKQTSLF